MPAKTKTNFWLDLTILIAFSMTTLTGLLLWLVLPGGRGAGGVILFGLTRPTWFTLHHWVGLGLLAGVLLHLALHWRWLVCVIRRFGNRLAGPTRLNFWLNSLLAAAFGLVNLSGLVVWLVLPGGGFRGGRNPAAHATLLALTRHQWQDLHLWAGLAMMGIVAVHLILHWPWLVCVARRYARSGACRQDECAPA